MEEFINKMPKAELHLHIEGSLEPDLIFELAKRNNIELKYSSISELQEAYNFKDLQSFLDVYYEGSKVLLEEMDFYDLTWAYLEKAKEQNIIHVEIFFDPQAHTSRDVSFDRVVCGIDRALKEGEQKLGISSRLIMCFLRDLSAESAMEMLEQSIPYKSKIAGIGLDSAEVGNPPSKFKEVFMKGIEMGYLPVAHAGEEGPPEYIREALDVLKILRIDHGVRCLEDRKLTEELIAKQIPLTVCPFSNVKLKVFKNLKDHNIKQMLDLGLRVTINSDDPSYFGGYLNENFQGIQKVFDLSKKEIYLLAKNSFLSSFISDKERNAFLKKLDDYYVQYL